MSLFMNTCARCGILQYACECSDGWLRSGTPNEGRNGLGMPFAPFGGPATGKWNGRGVGDPNTPVGRAAILAALGGARGPQMDASSQGWPRDAAGMPPFPSSASGCDAAMMDAIRRGVGDPSTPAGRAAIMAALGWAIPQRHCATMANHNVQTKVPWSSEAVGAKHCWRDQAERRAATAAAAERRAAASSIFSEPGTKQWSHEGLPGVDEIALNTDVSTPKSRSALRIISLHNIQFDTPKVKLGEGAFGIVYRSAVHGWQGQTVAVKVFKADDIVPEKVRKEFEHEARVLASFQHANIVSFLGVCREQRPMLVTEYLPSSLDVVLYPRNGRASQISTTTDRIHIAKDVSAGLAYIHSKPFLHRDLKPSNVLLTSAGVAKIADVGLARALHGTRQYMSATGIAGTPVYMSPEQWDELELDAKTDVYAFGIMLNEILTGQKPWRDLQSHMGIMRKVMKGERPSPVVSADLPKGGSSARQLVMACWSVEAAARPAMNEVYDSLKRLM